MQIPSRFVRIIGLLGLALALAACSTIKLGYNTLDDVAYWWLDGYIDFTDEQEARIKDDLDRLHAWHRAQELPRIEQLLKRIETMMPAPMDAQQACSIVPAVRERLEAVTTYAEPTLVSYATSLGPGQIDHLQKKYERNNAKFRKEWVRITADEVREKRLKMFLDRAETIYGSIGEPQREALRREIERSTFNPQRALAERERRQRDLLATLRQIAGQRVAVPQATTLIRGYLERAGNPQEPALRAQQQAWIDDTCRTVAALHNATTPAQREHAVRRLRGYQKDLRELATQN